MIGPYLRTDSLDGSRIPGLGEGLAAATLPRMLGRFARGFGWLAYVGLLAMAFGIVAYFSFSLFVRSGATAVPDLVGLPESELPGLLADHGLRLRRKYDLDRYHEKIPVGHVLQQSPGSGSMMKRGASVEVAVSMGPERLTVPDLEGKTLQAAQVLLTSANLSTNRIVNIFSYGAQPGTVVEQVPPASSKVGRNTAVTLFLSAASRADRYVMPDLAYRDLEAARLFFERRGFRLGGIKFEPYEGFSPGVILRQYPLPGHLLSRQDLISLVVTTMANE